MGPQLREAWDEYRAGLSMPAGQWTQLPPRTLLEVGSGMGEAIIAAAADYDLAIGVDVHVRGLAATMRAVRDQGLDNVRLVRGDAVDVLRDQVPAGRLAEIHVWFPDPWPKAKHHKRRLIRPSVVALMAARLRLGGVLRLATDVGEYATQMVEVIASSDAFEPVGESGSVPRPPWRPVTRYERYGRDRGNIPVELAFRRGG